MVKQIETVANKYAAPAKAAKKGIKIMKYRTWTVSNTTASTSEDGPVNIEIISSPIEVSGNLDLGTFAVISGPGNGTIINNYDWTVTYTPEAGFNGTDSFRYRVCDIYGYWDTATVTLSVNPVYPLANRNFSH